LKQFLAFSLKIGQKLNKCPEGGGGVIIELEISSGEPYY
jgi:hypothetical protein